jgi:hypothetical protein
VSGAAIGKPVAKLIAAGLVLAVALLAGAYGLDRALLDMTRFRDETELAILVVLAPWSMRSRCCLAGTPWLNSLLREVTVAADTKAGPTSSNPTRPTTPAVLPDNEPPPKA